MNISIQPLDDKLIYNSFTLVYFHLFDAEGISDLSHLKSRTNSLDAQIFNLKAKDENKLIKRYELRDFTMDIMLSGGLTVKKISEKVHVEAAEFYDSTFSVTYKLKVNRPIDHPEGFSTDDLIALSGILLGNEHWNEDEKNHLASIDEDISKLTIDKLFIESDGTIHKKPVSKLTGKKEQFTEVLARYKQLVTGKKGKDLSNDFFYVLVDVWEDVEHEGPGKFSAMTESEIISHIYTQHRSELMGLFTLYPKEWPYRNPDFFDEICGKNIAIDTDDLVLCNENICVVFGTYGKRKGPEAQTDWGNHLQIRDKVHVSWPEYLLILELLLARKHFLGKLHNSIATIEPNDTSELEEVTRESVKINNALLKMDALKFSRYCSHRHMYMKTALRLRITEEYNELIGLFQYVENQINNLRSLKEKRESIKLTILLAVISCVSIFQIFFYTPNIPAIERMTDINHLRTGEMVAFVINVLCVILVVFGFILIIVYMVNLKGYGRSYKANVRG